MSYDLDDVKKDLRRIEKKVDTILGLEGKAMAALDDLTAQVKENTDVEQSAITLIQQLADLIKQSASDPAKILALAGQLKSSAAALAAAVTANTPAAP